MKNKVMENNGHSIDLVNRLLEISRFVWASKTLLIGLIIVLFWIFVAICAPYLTSYSPTEMDWTAANQGPSASHILGTDELGRDLWTRLCYGARVILIYLPISDNFFIPGGTALWSVFGALLVGCTLGLISGYYGGWPDEIIMRLLDAMMSIPVLLLYLIIVASLGASALNIVIAITIVGTPGIARLVRGLTLDIRTREYVAAAEVRADPQWEIMFKEILPNARGPIIVDAMLRVGYSVFAMGNLGFLGLGVPPPSPDWGSMIAAGRQFVLQGIIWQALWPAIAIASLVVGLNLIADGLREESTKYQ